MLDDQESQGAAERWAEAAAEKKHLLFKADAYGAVRKFIESDCKVGDACVLKFWRDDFYYWRRTHYASVEYAQLKGRIWKYLDSAKTLNAGKNVVSYMPKIADVSNFMEVLKAETGLAASTSAPCALSGGEGANSAEFIAVKNGLLHAPSGTLHPPTPYFFNTTALNVDFDPDDTEIANWLTFLRQIWPNDQQEIDTLQEIMGYLLIPDTSMQKIFSLVGASRGGKGVILKVIQSLLGEGTFTSSGPTDLADRFGLEPLVNKLVCFFPDAGMKHMAPSVKAAFNEKLKKISGEDQVNAQRKNKSDWVGKLPTRLVIVTNDLPTADNSGALVNRYILLYFTQTFMGREDPKLFENKLKPELTGILNWALDGLRRLRHRGYFVQPQSSEDVISEIAASASVEREFVDACCVLDKTEHAFTDDLYACFLKWCERSGHRQVPSKNWFSRNLRSAFPGQISEFKPIQILPDGGKKQVPALRGIKVTRL